MIALFAEFLGTFALVLSIFFTGNWLMIGLTLALVIYAIGGISGGHVNPAVSFAMYMKGSLGMTEFLQYSAVQLLGGFAAVYAQHLLI
jgi:aquaporin Z